MLNLKALILAVVLLGFLINLALVVIYFIAARVTSDFETHEFAKHSLKIGLKALAMSGAATLTVKFALPKMSVSLSTISKAFHFVSASVLAIPSYVIILSVFIFFAVFISVQIAQRP